MRPRALEALSLPGRHQLHLIVHLARGRAQNERAHSPAGQRDVGVGAQDVDLGVGNDHASPGRVLNREPRLATL